MKTLESPSVPASKETFSSWFERQNFRHFAADEFIWHFNHTARGVKNSQPPRDLWPLIVPTLRVVDDLRDHFGRSIHILSSYRSPAYNKPIDGAATKSFHMKFQALDITVAGKSPKEERI